MSKHVVIIGNGVAGVTAARFIRKERSDYAVTVISDETDHFYARTALMYLYMGHMRYEDTKPYEDGFWKKNRIGLVRNRVERIDTEAKTLHLRDGSPVGYDVLLIAAGSRPRRAGWPGQDLDGVQGLYGMGDLDQMERSTADVRRAVVVGGGLIGVEAAEMLHTRQIPVTFLVRESRYWAHVLPPEESEIVGEEIREHGIDLRLETELDQILPDERGRVRAVVTKAGEEIACEFVLLSIGVQPVKELAEAAGIETGRGILVNRFLETSAADVYAAGDCAEFREEGVGHKPVEQLWYTGRKHGQTVARTICGKRTAYDRGIFFNSAKFFTVEYQTYGDVRPEPTDGVETISWTSPDEKKLIRIDYAAEDGRVLGFNTLGVRYRQAVCEAWIQGGRPVGYVLSRLREANFDPEFAPRHEKALAAQYDGRHPERAASPDVHHNGRNGRTSGLFARWFKS